MQTRRDFLKLAAMLSSAGGLAGFVPDSLRRALAIAPDPGSTYLDADHIVILMQENRSFDHAFGSLRGVRGFNDPRAMRLANGNSVFVQTDEAGNSYAPWRLDIRDTRITWMGSLPHSRHSQIDAWNNGRHDGWLDAKRSGEKEYGHLPLTMGHFTREDLPFYYALADAFTICDQNYCSVMTSTSPNRSYFWTGTIREEQRAGAKVHIRNEQIDDGGMTWKTFPERLQEAGISWRSYQNELTRSGLSGEEDAWLSNYGDNVLECFASYNVEAYPGFIAATKRWMVELLAQAENLKTDVSNAKDAAEAAKLRREMEKVRSQMDRLSTLAAQGGEARYRQLSDQQKALHHAAFATNAADRDYHTLDSLSFEFDGKMRNMQVPKGDVLYQFRKDVNEGKLPTISWLTAPERFSDHPSSPWYGAWYLSEVIDILTQNPQVWKKTIFILTYDENDGYFDHVPSFVAADPKRPDTGGASSGVDTGFEYNYKEEELSMGVAPDEARSGPIGMGFRVPMIIASPWSRGGWVNSQLFDHTSTLMFLETFVRQKFRKEVREENISAWRRTVAGDLTSVFRPYDGNEPALDFIDRNKFSIEIEQARYKEIPSNFQKLNQSQIEEINQAPRRSPHTSHQEPGTRPACALPYELYAEGGLNSDGARFDLRLAAGNAFFGTRAAGAPFNVYLRNLEATIDGFRALTYTVRPGDEILPRFPLSLFKGGEYAIEVYGPNGFYRSFAGAGESPHVLVKADYERNGTLPTGNIVVHLRNPGSNDIALNIAESAYRIASERKKLDPGESVSVIRELKTQHGWYDFTVSVEGSDAKARFAGRTETGRPTMSDPLIAATA
jgi:phospholipase C